MVGVSVDHDVLFVVGVGGIDPVCHWVHSEPLNAQKLSAVDRDIGDDRVCLAVDDPDVAWAVTAGAGVNPIGKRVDGHGNRKPPDGKPGCDLLRPVVDHGKLARGIDGDVDLIGERVRGDPRRFASDSDRRQDRVGPDREG